MRRGGLNAAATLAPGRSFGSGAGRLTRRLVLCGMIVAPPLAALFMTLAVAANTFFRGDALDAPADAVRLLASAMAASIPLGCLPGALAAAIVALVRRIVGPMRPSRAIAAIAGAAIAVSCVVVGVPDFAWVGPGAIIESAPLQVALLPTAAVIVLLRRPLGIAALVDPLPHERA